MNGEHWRQTGTTSIVTAIATVASVIGYMHYNPPREDPFTGSEANALRVELERKISAESAEIKDDIKELKKSLERLDDAHRRVMERNRKELRNPQRRSGDYPPHP
jgi:hypothetical protein